MAKNEDDDGKEIGKTVGLPTITHNIGINSITTSITCGRKETEYPRTIFRC